MRPRLFPERPRPLVFAHRGVSARAPENSLAAFRLAKEEGIPGIELDIHLTADGKLAIIHDDDTGRTAGAPGIRPGPAAKGKGLRIEETISSDLRTLDIGLWKGERFSGERILFLEELFEEFGDGFYYDIEIKARSREDRGLEAALIKAIRQAVAGRGIDGSCLVSSFNPLSLARFKALEPRIPTAIIWCSDPELPWYLRHGEGRWIGKADVLKPAKEKLSRAAFLRWALLGYECLPWTVDEGETARTLVRRGAAGLISNDPSSLGLASQG